MANAILSQFTAASAITVSLGSLANGSGRQGTVVDNTSNKYPRVLLTASIKLGTSPSSNTAVTIYLIRDDNNGFRTDGAGASDAAFTPKNAQYVGTLSTGGSASTGDVLCDIFLIDEPGPKWTVAFLNSTGVALDSTGGNHTVEFVGVNPQIQ